MERRTRYDVYSSILDTVRRRGSIGITRISYSVGIPVDRAKIAVSFLVERGLIEEEEHDEMKTYKLTARGGESLQALKTVKRYLGLEDNQ
jgi:predicted transcriptional regulator